MKTQDELNTILENHEKWLKNEGGKFANLSFKNLSGCNLNGANLATANILDVNLRGSYYKRRKFYACRFKRRKVEFRSFKRCKF